MKGPMYFAIDIDGTLLNSRQTIDEPNRVAIERAMNEGHHIGLATGRVPKSALMWARHLETNAPVIALNGADVIDIQSGESLYSIPIATQPLFELIRYARATGLHYRLFGHGCVVCDKREFERVRPLIQTYYRGMDILSEEDVLAYLERPVEPVLKVAIGCGNEQFLAQVYEELSSWHAFELARTEDFEIEITQRSAGKLSGIIHVMEMLKISLVDVVAIGNGHNDLQMLRHVGTGYAMANSDPIVLEQVALRTASNDDHGVAKAIERELAKLDVKFA